MSTKDLLVVHPKLAIFAIGLGITMVIGTAMGKLEHGQLVFASS